MMKIKHIISYLSASAVTLTSTLVFSSPTLSQQPNFFCGVKDSSPATIVQSAKYGDIPIIVWNSSAFEASGYDNQTRCNMVSGKFQSFSTQGNLKFFTHGTVNRQPVICAIADKNSPCNGDSLLFTLKPGTDAGKTLKNLFDIRSGATTEALEETESRVYIDFEQLLATKAQEKEEATVEPTSGEVQNPATNPSQPRF
jgi:hypothetical protein